MALWYKGLPQNGSKAKQQDINYLMLYDAGDECVEVTGGWSNYNYSSGYGSGTVSNSSVKNSTSITIKSVFNAASSTAGISGYMTEHLDLSSYSGALACFDSAEQIGLQLCSSKTPTITVGNGATIKTGFVRVSGQASIIGDCKISYLNVEQIENAYLFTGVSEWLPGGTYQGNLYHVCLVGTDDWQTWLDKAGLTVSDYASLDAVIADNAALTTLMSGKAAVDYMLYHCTGTVMAAVIQSQDALEAIADSPYNARIFDNKHWDKFLRMAGAVPETEKMYLYKDGNELSNFYKFAIYEGRLPVSITGTMTRLPDCIEFYRGGYYEGDEYNYVAGVEKINFGGYKRLCADVAVTRKNNNCSICIFATDTGEQSKLIVAGLGIHTISSSAYDPPLNEIRRYTLDISNLTANYHIAVCTYDDTLRVYRLWLER